MKRWTRTVTRVALGVAMGGTLFAGTCDSQALQIAGVGLDAAASLLNRGNTSDVRSVVDFLARL